MIKELLKKRILVIDGAMGTQLQAKAKEIPPEAWQGKEGCNELLNRTAPEVIRSIHEAYAKVGADIIKTNTFGSMPWVLEEYDLAAEAYDLTRRGCELVKEVCEAYSTPEKPRFVACSLGPGTKLPSLGHIDYDAMYAGYSEAARGAKDGGADLFLLETCQDPLQIKAAIHACQDTAPQIPIMVSVTIEQNGTMLIGTDAATIATILEPFDIISLGFNCGTGPDMVEKHVKILSEVWDRPISVHANAGLPQNRGGYTYYPMGPKEFTELEAKFTAIPGVALLGGCCGTTPQHIKALVDAVEGKKPLPPKGRQPRSIASLFESRTLHQDPPPFLMGERSNATGSKAFRELLLKSDYEGTLSVAQQQVRSGAHGIDVSVGFAGRDETKDMKEVIKLYNEKIPIPLMPDSTQVPAIEIALKHIGGRPIINSANLEDGIEKFDKICSLAKRYGAALVLLAIDEEGMAKTKEKKLAVAERMYERAVNLHGLNPGDLVFDLLTFTVGSGDEEYQTAAIETIEAIRELRKRHPEVGAVLGVSNISFGLEKHAREYLNSVFLHHCVQAGLTMAIVNVKNLIPYHKISEEDRKVCEDLLFNRRENGDPLFAFIEHFSKAEKKETASDDELSKLPLEEQIHKLLIDGDKERMMPLLEKAKDVIDPEKIINEILIGAMKEVGDLFGSGQMQLPFVLQSAEVMKAAVDYLNQFLPKKEKQSQTTLILGTVKGDVHDVGKNLVDILLTNNGFKVVNLGIKVELEEFIKAYEEHNAQAIGMSGLLVKSTQVMLENLKEMKQKGIDAPVLLGGAALTKKFVDEFCRPAYDGPIFYCRDAFDGIVAMSRIEKGNFDTKLGSDKDEEEIVEVKPKEEIKIDPANIILPKPAPVPIPPFWGRKRLEIDPDIAYEWINKRLLFKQRWGYKSKGQSKEEYQKQLDEKVLPAFNRLRKELKDIFEPTILYGYWPARAVDNELYVFGEEFGWQRDEDANREPIENIIGDAIEIFTFPRQSKPPHRCIADYFHRDRMDVSAFTCVSAGSKFSEYEGELFKAGKYHEYHLVHGLSVELAEALAEIAHKQIRIELGILRNEKPDLRDVKMVGYQGARYSPGYPACPDLELNRHIFNLLKPEEFGIELSETFQIHPEQSTCAIVVHHPEAKYFNV
ncbi:5-methyltetrahydrofolate--homocysteine methyltransferase [Nitratiruptor sp. YY08-26]|uniref:methionine synthase n=1 Tax=unclassified Nitratiruptor TaxID=2624044 RepID=UPI0019161448|nr:MULTISPECIES: methionine synthase [unclassified Nitratiruptor]BCD61799.1 5-methyltetrahydrofolate--homocysteine methyltransferase [Nitratiruptor sp. YY08-13]BCD65734.1 5-methyltetrahydrofolate--homocysteine methyltransferase [Nitratiruptor sp. YY08-26]